MRRKLPRCAFLPVVLLLLCRLLTDPGPAAGAVVFTPRISSLPTIGPSPRIQVQLDVPPDAALSPDARAADMLRRRARLWLAGLQAGADSLAHNRAAARYFIGADARLILAAMLYGATGPDEAAEGHIDFILEPAPFGQVLERALRPGPLYGAWQSLLDELRAALARTPSPDSPEEARQAAWLRALLGPARRALAAADDGWLATADQALELEHAATRVEESPLLWLLLAEATLQRDQPQRSVGACGRALALDPRLARARYIRALGYWRLHQLALAENDLSLILHDAPHASMTPWLRARGAIRMLRGNTTGMCEDFLAACVQGGDCDGLEMARQQGLCREEQPAVTAEVSPGRPSAAEGLPPDIRRRADYLGSLVLAFLGSPEPPVPLDGATATALGFLPPDSRQTPFCPRFPSRALGALAARTLPVGSPLDGHDLPLVDEDPHWLDARRRGTAWAEDVLVLLGVDPRLSRLPAEELRDRAAERVLHELDLAPLRALAVRQCPRRLWAVPAQWKVSAPVSDAVLAELWAVIDATRARAREMARRMPEQATAAPPADTESAPPEAANELRGMTPRRPVCPLPRRGGSLAAAWGRIWDDAWAVRIKTLAYVLRDEETPAAVEREASARRMGPPPPPRLQEGRWGYPPRWNWILWPGQAERRGMPPAGYGACMGRR